MSVTKNILAEIRKDLKKASPPEPEVTSRQLVQDLAPMIHERLRKGMTLANIYPIIVARLPEKSKLSATTFRRYWREAREETGLPKVREARITDRGKTHTGTRKTTPSRKISQTNDDFRNDPEGF